MVGPLKTHPAHSTGLESKKNSSDGEGFSLDRSFYRTELSVHPEVNSAELRNPKDRPLRPRASSRNDCANFVPNVRERSYLNVTFSMRVLRGN